MPFIVAFLGVLSTFLFEGVRELFHDVIVAFMSWLIPALISLKIWFLTVMWEVAQNILVNMGLSDAINAAWGNLDSVTLSYLTFFRLPEALMVLIQAVVTKFSLRMVGL